MHVASLIAFGARWRESVSSMGRSQSRCGGRRVVLSTSGAKFGQSPAHSHRHEALDGFTGAARGLAPPRIAG
jgi:hypothetical protein